MPRRDKAAGAPGRCPATQRVEVYRDVCNARSDSFGTTMKLLADGGNSELLITPTFAVVNDSQRAACMSLMAIFCVGRLSPRVARRVHEVRQQWRTTHVLTDKPLFSQPLPE